MGPLSHAALVDTGGMWDYWKRKQLSERTLEDTESRRWKSSDAAGMGEAEVTSGHNFV